MKKANKRYTDYDKDFILASLKVGAQNGISQEIIAEQIAPVLCRKPSAIVSQMYLMRSEWVKKIQNEMTLAYSKVKHDREEIKNIETEYTSAIEPEPVTEHEEVEPEPETIEFTPVLKPDLTLIEEPVELPCIGDEIEVVIIGIREFGAIVKASKYDMLGLIHISNITEQYVEHVSDWLHLGQRVNAIITKQENDGRYGFSSKDAADKNVWKLGVTTAQTQTLSPESR